MNLELYNKVRVVPEEAKKEITGGRLNGMTDINPMWRIKTLTEQFGECGKGWYYEVIGQRFVDGAEAYNDKGEVLGKEIACFVDISLYVNDPAVGWSKPIHGIGGSMYISKEKRGLYTDDECLKKAETDALGVACKSLGIGADVYWGKDATKYNTEPQTIDKTQQGALLGMATTDGKKDDAKVSILRDICRNHKYESIKEIKPADYEPILLAFGKAIEEYKKAQKELDEKELPFDV